MNIEITEIDFTDTAPYQTPETIMYTSTLKLHVCI